MDPVFRDSMDLGEIEFVAENLKTKIVPNFTLEKIYLISGDIGPFYPGLQIEVPLWLAKHLYKNQQCRVQPPEWFNYDTIFQVRENEKSSEEFTKLPNPHFHEISKTYLLCCEEQTPQIDEIRTLIKDIWDIRSSKLRTSITNFIKQQASRAKIDNLTKFEINHIEPFLATCLDEIHLSRQFVQNAENNLSSQQSVD